MPVMIICQGPPGSGKSTWSREMEATGSFVRVNWDDIRERIGGGWSRELEKQVVKESQLLAAAAEAEGYNVIIDNTNMNPRTLQSWIDYGTKHGFEVQVKQFRTPLLECIERDSKREGRARVGRPVIERMALQAGWVEWQPGKRVVIFDMDGTLSDCSWRRPFLDGSNGKKNWKAFFEGCDQDPAVEAVLQWAKAVGTSDEYELVIVSGRPEDLCGEKTVSWLEKHGVPYSHLFMRKRGDNRQDDIVKEEILKQIGRERVAFVVDDRNQVVEMWRRNKVTCYQVAEGNF